MKRHIVGISTVVLAMGVAMSAAADSRLAFSTSRQVEIRAIGQPWCKTTLALEMRLQSASSPLTNRQARLRFFPKLKPAIEAECPAAKRVIVRVIGHDGKALPSAGIMHASKAKGWVATEASPAAAASGAQGAKPAGASALTPDEDTAAKPANVSLFESAKLFTSEDLILATLAYLPQYADLSKFPGVSNTLGAVYACSQWRIAQSDEFKAEAQKTAMQEKLRSLTLRADSVKKKLFKVRYKASLGRYDFKRGGFPHNAFGGTLDAGNIKAQRGCRPGQRNGLPWDFYIKFADLKDVNLLPMGKAAAEAYTARMRSRNYNRRNIIIDVVYKIAGVHADGLRGTLLADTIAVRMLDPVTRQDLGNFGKADIENMKKAAATAAARLEAERKARKRAALRASLQSQREDVLKYFVKLFDAEQNRLKRIANAMGRHEVGERLSDRLFLNPAVAASRARRNGDPVQSYVIFKAGGNGKDAIKAAWPVGLHVSIKGRKAGELHKNNWYVAFGEIKNSRQENEKSPVLPAVLKASWIYSCTEEACAEADDADAMLDAATARIDKTISELETDTQ